MNKELERKMLAGVDALLGKTGTLDSHGLHHQNEQHQYARAVAKGLARGTDEMASMTLLEAGTGIGKTIGYGVALALWVVFTDNRAAISTYTLHLQRQIIGKDMPSIIDMVAEYTGRELVVARRIGIRNFVSYSRLHDMTSDIKRTEDNLLEWAVMDDLLHYAKESAKKNSAVTGEIAQFIEENGLTRLPFDLTAEQICLSADCPDKERIAFDTHCMEAKEADIVVTSHAMTILHTKTSFGILDEEKPITALVLDEADKFPEAAQSILSQRFPVVRVRAMLEKIDHPEFVKCANAARKMEAEILKVRDDNGGANFIPNPTHHQDLNAAMGAFAKDLRSVIKFATVEGNKAKKKDVQNGSFGFDKVFKEQLAELAGYSMRLIELARQFRGEGDPNKTMIPNISFSPSRNFPTLSVTPTNSGYLLSKLWLPRKDEDGDESLYLKACLMTSATLGDPGQQDVDGRFTRFMYECGIFAEKKAVSEAKKRQQVLQVNKDLFNSFEPLMFGRMEFILADPRLPKPLMKMGVEESSDEDDDGENYLPKVANPEWLNYVANAVCYANTQLGGRTLVLTNSYRDTEVIAEMLQSVPWTNRPRNIVMHNRGMRLGELVELYKRDSDSILITPSGWEGLSIVSGETKRGMVDNLVVTRLPYGGKDGVNAKVLENSMRQKGRSREEIRAVAQALYVSAARRKMMQGLGRGIRSRLDYCRVIITDPRFPMVDSAKSKEEFGAGKVRTQSSFHHCVPKRFFPALRDAKILRMDGSIFDPKANKINIA